jgi:hypothetical protein
MFMLTESEIEQWKQKINEMTQMECAKLQRFAPSGHPVFRSDGPLADYFQTHFQSLGGMTPQISKAIGHAR